MDIVELKEIGGLAVLSGIDQLGRHWFEFSVDPDREGRSRITCCKCGESISVGWMCTENEEIRCDRDVKY